MNVRGLKAVHVHNVSDSHPSSKTIRVRRKGLSYTRQHETHSISILENLRMLSSSVLSDNVIVRYAMYSRRIWLLKLIFLLVWTR